MAAKKRHGLLLGQLSLVVVGMFAFGFALVPLYDALCNITGLNGKSDSIITAAEDIDFSVDEERLVTVQFLTTVNPEYALGIQGRPDPGQGESGQTQYCVLPCEQSNGPRYGWPGRTQRAAFRCGQLPAQNRVFLLYPAAISRTGIT